MPLRLLPWSPDRGTSMQFEADADGSSTATIELGVERPWAAVPPPAAAPPPVQIVDGVRRVDAHAMDDGPDGRPLPALFGSLGVGAVRCDGGSARILDDERAPRFERRYLQTGGEPQDRELRAGSMTLLFQARTPPGAQSANDLMAALQRTMLDEEAKLAEELSRDESTLTLVDGPLRLRSPGPRVVGYVKRFHQWYVGAAEQALIPRLRVGERTPLFRIEDGTPRYAWFMCIAELGALFHPLSGVVRLEALGEAPLDAAVRLAEQCAVALPRLASSPIRDARAPQNLTPVGALEASLTHRLGDPLRVRRLLAASLAPEQHGERTAALAGASTAAGNGTGDAGTGVERW